VEVIFPVSQDAVSATGSGDDLAVVPGVRGGEGCSTAGTSVFGYQYGWEVERGRMGLGDGVFFKKERGASAWTV
jgi:hypothetical protein